MSSVLTPLRRLRSLSRQLSTSAPVSASSRPAPPPNWKLGRASPNADGYTPGDNQPPPFPCAEENFAQLDPTVVSCP